MVSFVLPAYKKKYLSLAINSILAQTEPEWELVVVNDASPEDIKSVVMSFDDPRIRYYENEKNIGGSNLVEQWNHCIEFAVGEWIVLASDDDVYHPDFLKECMRLAESYPQVDLVHTRVRQIDEQGEQVGWEDGRLPEYADRDTFFKAWLDGAVFVCIGNYMFRAGALKEKRFVDFPCAFGSDSATCLMLAENGVANTEEPLFEFRQSSIHLSSSVNLDTLHKKLEANTMQFQFFKSLGLEEVVPASRLYAKCKYDYYNLVIKHLPISKLYWILDCTLLKAKDKAECLMRYFYDKTFKKFRRS